MAKDENVKIHLSTTSDPKGVEDVEVALERLDAEATAAEKTAKELRQELDKLDGSHKELGKSLRHEVKRLDEVAKSARKTQAAYRDHGATVGKVVSQKHKLNKANSKLGLGFLEVSRAVEDAQYGLRGVLNNIPQIITLFGGTAGLAAVVSLAAVAFAQLSGRMEYSKKKTDDLAERVQAFADGELENLKTALDDHEAIYGFAQAQDDAQRSTSKLTGELKDQLQVLKGIRKINLEVAESEANVELAQIEASEGSEVEKIQQRGVVQARLAALRNEDELETMREQRALYDQLIKARAAEIRSIEEKVKRTQEEFVTSSQIRKVEADIAQSQKRAGEFVKKVVSEIDGRNMPKGLLTIAAIDGDNRGGREHKEARQRMKEFAVELVTYVEKLDEALSTGDGAAARSSLLQIASLGERNEAQRSKTSTDRSYADRNLSVISENAAQALMHLTEVTDMGRSAEQLRDVQEVQKEFLKSAPSEMQELGSSIKEAADKLVSLELSISRQSEINANNAKAANIKQQADMGRAEKVLQDRQNAKAEKEQKRQEREKQRAEKLELSELNDKLENSGYGIGQEAERIAQLIEKQGSRVLADAYSQLEKAFADGKLNRAEQHQLAPLIDKLAQSQRVQSSATLNALNKAIAQYQEQARKIATLESQLKNR